MAVGVNQTEKSSLERRCSELSLSFYVPKLSENVSKRTTNPVSFPFWGACICPSHYSDSMVKVGCIHLSESTSSCGCCHV